MDGPRLLRRGQRREADEEGLQHRRLLGQHDAGDVVGALGVPVHRQHEGLRAPRGDVALADQRVERGDRRRLLARYALRQREAAAGGVVVRMRGQHRLVIGLRAALVPRQVVGEAAIPGEFRIRHAEPAGIGEQAQRVLRLFELDERGAEPGLHPPVIRRDVLRAAEEADRRIGIAEDQGVAAGGGERRQIARLGGQRAQRLGEQFGRIGARRQRLDDGTGRRLGQRGRGGREQERGNQQPAERTGQERVRHGARLWARMNGRARGDALPHAGQPASSADRMIKS